MGTNCSRPTLPNKNNCKVTNKAKSTDFVNHFLIISQDYSVINQLPNILLKTSPFESQV